jgi:hypothetical protein
MKLGWLRFRYIDPALRLSREQREMVLARALQSQDTKRRINRTIWLAVPAAIASLAVTWALQQSAPVAVIAATTFLAACYLAVAAAARWALQPSIDQALAAFGHTKTSTVELTCFHCGHSLPADSAEGLRCPECGVPQQRLYRSVRPLPMLFMHADPVMAMLPTAARREIRVAVTNGNVIGIAVTVVLPLVATAGLAWAVLHLGGPMLAPLPIPIAPALPAWLMYVMLSLVAWWFAARLARFTVGRRIRAALRGLGYDVCPGCGVLLQTSIEQTPDCDACGRTRAPLEHPADGSGPIPTAAELALIQDTIDLVWAAPRDRGLVEQLAMLLPAVGLLLGFTGLVLGWPATGLIPTAVVLPTMFWLMERSRSVLREGVYAALEDAGHPICVACGSWIRSRAFGCEACDVTPASPEAERTPARESPGNPGDGTRSPPAAPA